MASPPSFGLGGGTNHSLRDVGKAEPRAEVDRPIASQGINVDMRSLFELPVKQNPHTPIIHCIGLYILNFQSELSYSAFYCIFETCTSAILKYLAHHVCLNILFLAIKSVSLQTAKYMSANTSAYYSQNDIRFKVFVKDNYRFRSAT